MRISAYAFLLSSLVLIACGKDKVVIRYLLPPAPIDLISPDADAFISADTATFVWHRVADVIRYQLQVSRSPDFLQRSLDVLKT